MSTEQDIAPGRPALTTKEGWARFVDYLPATVTLLRPKELAALNEVERALYDEARIEHHTEVLVAKTPTMMEIIRTGRELTMLNRRQVSARRGLIVTGEPGTGKTTAITQLGKAHEQHVRRRLPAGAGPRMPVVYVTVPPAATPKMLAMEFARFLGIPLVGSQNQAQITNAVCEVLAELGCELVLVDEIHNLNLTTRAGAEASDQLKYLSERITATFVYAGIDVEQAGLFTGTRGKQIAGRFVSVAAKPFTTATAAHKAQWQQLLATMEQSLRLHRHRPGTLVGQSDLLHHRTSGMIGSLAHLVRAAAVRAILSGTERITVPILEDIPLDTAAEASAPRRRTARTAGTRQRKAAG
ncbi:AAA family ATPase [Kitasatospora sp. NPDC001540]|uniref:AAA family ATPase n=1 Tax=Kitasatospora sp. NPDC001540 TaxID=3364014 RepID=UPI0036836853